MPEDLDSLYSGIEGIARDVNGPLLRVDSKYVKYFKYTATYNETFTITEDTNNASVSQYQESIIRLTLDDSFYSASMRNIYDGYSISLFISGPEDDEVPNSTSATSDDNFQNKFAHVVHLKPVIGSKGVFEFHLNELLGRQMKIGNKNKVKFVFMIVAHNKNSDLYEKKYMNLLSNNSPITINMYKTNSKYSNQIDDLSNAFIALGELKELI